MNCWQLPVGIWLDIKWNIQQYVNGPRERWLARANIPKMIQHFWLVNYGELVSIFADESSIIPSLSIHNSHVSKLLYLGIAITILSSFLEEPAWIPCSIAALWAPSGSLARGRRCDCFYWWFSLMVLGLWWMICDEWCWNLLSPKRSDFIQWKWGVVFGRERDFADKRARIQCISCTQSRI